MKTQTLETEIDFQTALEESKWENLIQNGVDEFVVPPYTGASVIPGLFSLGVVSPVYP